MPSGAEDFVPHEMRTIAILVGLGLMMQVAINIMIPALPAIGADLRATPVWEKLTLTAFMIGYGLSPLVIGPLSDRFGRRPVLLGGLALYAIAGLGCTFAASIEALVAARLLQGVGGGAGLVIHRAIARDLYAGIKLARVSAYLSAGQGVGPMLAPLVGALLQEQFGWRATFAFTALFGAAVWVAYGVAVPESNMRRTPRLDLPALVRGYSEVLRARQFLWATLTSALSVASYYTFFAGAPTFFIGPHGVTPSQFGLFVSLCGVAFILAGVLTGRMVATWGEARLLAASLGFGFVGVGGCAALAAFGVTQLWSFFIPMFAYVAAAGILMPLLSAAALGPYPHAAGTAAASYVVLFTGLCAMGTVAAGLVESISRTAFFGVMLVFQCLSVITYLALGKRASRDDPTQ